jgi:hypothetical protein
MSVLPSPGPARTRLLILIGLLAGATTIAVYQWNSANSTAISPAAPVSQMASNTSRAIAQATTPARPGTPRPVATVPEPLKLPDLERVPDEPATTRNPFRFGVKPPPPAPPAPPPPIYTPPPPPLPPPPPQVPLTLAGVMADPYGKNRAYLVDKTGAFFEAVEGQIVDGRYRVVAVGKDTAVVEFVDGSSRRTLRVGIK